MYPVSSGFLAALASSSMVAVSRVRTTAGVVLGFSSGNVTMDSRRAIVRSAELTLTPTPEQTAEDVYALVMAATTEIVVERGLMVGGVAEYVPLGVFSADKVKIDKKRAGAVSFTGSDRSKKIARARFEDPYQIASGTSLATAGSALLADRLPGVETDFSAVNEIIGAQIVCQAGADSDPWKEVTALFYDHGYDLEFDGDGVCRARAVPDPSTSEVVFSFGSGETNLILGAEREGTPPTYNGVIATGEGTELEAPVRAVVWDDDPSSPTYYGSGFGKAPYFYSSPLLTDSGKAEQAARTILARIKGKTEQLSWPAVVNPALTPLDVVTVNIGGVGSTCVLDALTIPLKAADAMNSTARETRSA